MYLLNKNILFSYLITVLIKKNRNKRNNQIIFFQGIIMKKLVITTVLYISMFALICDAVKLDARTKEKGKGEQPGMLRGAADLFDVQQNTVSNIQFYTSNYGIFGLNVKGNTGGGFWPRGSVNQYIFGGGIWFGASKVPSGAKRPNKLVEISYNPNSGASWMVPGRVEDDKDPIYGGTYLPDDDSKLKYRTYFSTDFDQASGIQISSAGPNWPIWHTDLGRTLREERYVGKYVDDIAKRDTTVTKNGPAFISEEDIVSVYKDTDLDYNEGGSPSNLRKRGYPLILDFEQTIYSWGSGDYGDFIFMRYNIINRSKEALRDCWMAPAFDFDLAPSGNGSGGAGNDRCRYVDEDTTLNLAVQWSGTNQGEKNFGYIGLDFLESPAINPLTGFIRKDKKFYDGSEQLGLKTFRNWVIANDPSGDDERYDFISSNTRDIDNGPGDKRFLMATGPFNIAAGDTARVVVGIILANPPVPGVPATGTPDDLSEMIRKDKFAQYVYDNNFKAPSPPFPNILHWQPLSNGILLSWDSTAEVSVDLLADGLDFAGYKLYRARRTDLDTFSTSEQAGSVQYTKGTGPFGWKELASWKMPVPFLKSAKRLVDNNANYPLIDSLNIVSLQDTTYNVVRVIDPKSPWVSFFQSLPTNELKALLQGKIVVYEADRTNDLDQLYNYISAKKISTSKNIFPIFGDRQDVKQFIAKYMDSITGHKTYIDIGDDNHDGSIDESTDLTKREKLINNIDYWYRLIAYDEGDYQRYLPKMVNKEQPNKNLAHAYPIGAAASNPPQVTFYASPEDSAKLGGLYNFRFDIKDADRTAQIFGNHELEIEFSDGWFALGTSAAPFGVYTRNFNIYDRGLIDNLYPQRKFLAKYASTLNALSFIFGGSLAGQAFFSERAQYFDFTDTTLANCFSAQNTNCTEKRNSSGTFASNDIQFGQSIYQPYQYIYDAFALDFDYALQQWGGDFRTDDASIAVASPKSNKPNTPLVFTPEFQAVQAGMLHYKSFNNGPAEYELVFTGQGTETLTFDVGNSKIPTTKRTVVFKDVPYMTIGLKNKVNYKRTNSDGSTAPVTYKNYSMPNAVQQLPSVYTTQFSDTSAIVSDPANIAAWPQTRLVPIGSYNLSAFPWVNGRAKDDANSRKNQNSYSGAPCGTQGRYYLSAISADGKDTVDFTHYLLASGGEFRMDFANKHGRNVSSQFGSKVSPGPTVDFSVGDTARFNFLGGAAGFPIPGTKIRARISNPIPQLDQYTDDLMNQIKVVPNPYFVSHEGQATTDNAKLYFTKLPKQCKISIYTVNGDLIKIIQHTDNDADPSTHALEVWNLLSDGKQRVSSQTLVAIIEAPNGAKTELKFSVIVGGFRNVAR